MERVQGARTPYEVYCPHCRVTFPREARRCIHCGGRLGAPGRPVEVEAPPRMGPPDVRPQDPSAEAGAEEEEDTRAALLRRFGGLAVWAVLALAAVLSNMCQGRG